MNNTVVLLIIFLLCFAVCGCLPSNSKTLSDMKNNSSYNVHRVSGPMTIDARWDKPQWEGVQALLVPHSLGDTADFIPVVEAKLLYDSANIYVIFKVIDRYVRVLTSKINGPVWEDSAVEFFFCPNANLPDQYFNVEINAGGTPLMGFRRSIEADLTFLESKDIRNIEIAHSLPKLIDPERVDSVTWVLEYRLPLSLLGNSSALITPAPGVHWKANFFKIAENNSNPHYITWSEILNKQIDFHQPAYFGTLRFQ